MKSVFSVSLLWRRLGDAEVDHLHHRPVGLEGDHDIGRLEVAVDDPFLVSVVDGGTDVLEKGETLAGVELLIAAETSVMGTPLTSSIAK